MSKSGASVYFNRLLNVLYVTWVPALSVATAFVAWIVGLILERHIRLNGTPTDPMPPGQISSITVLSERLFVISWLFFGVGLAWLVRELFALYWNAYGSSNVYFGIHIYTWIRILVTITGLALVIAAVVDFLWVIRFYEATPLTTNYTIRGLEIVPEALATLAETRSSYIAIFLVAVFTSGLAFGSSGFASHLEGKFASYPDPASSTGTSYVTTGGLFVRGFTVIWLPAIGVAFSAAAFIALLTVRLQIFNLAEADPALPTGTTSTRVILHEQFWTAAWLFFGVALAWLMRDFYAAFWDGIRGNAKAENLQYKGGIYIMGRNLLVWFRFLTTIVALVLNFIAYLMVVRVTEYYANLTTLPGTATTWGSLAISSTIGLGVGPELAVTKYSVVDLLLVTVFVLNIAASVLFSLEFFLSAKTSFSTYLFPSGFPFSEDDTKGIDYAPVSQAPLPNGVVPLQKVMIQQFEEGTVAQKTIRNFMKTKRESGV
jgi:hypothetical protein